MAPNGFDTISNFMHFLGYDSFSLNKEMEIFTCRNTGRKIVVTYNYRAVEFAAENGITATIQAKYSYNIREIEIALAELE